MDSSSVPCREEIEPTYRWRLDHVYEAPERWEEAFRRVEGMIEQVAARAGTLGESATSLARTLEVHAELGEELDRLVLYASLRRDEDTRDPSGQERAERASRLASRSGEATAFIEPEILAISREKLEGFLGSEALAPWEHYLRNLLRMKEHTLSPREEELLAMAGEMARTARSAFGMLNDADLTFRGVRDEEGREVELTKGRYSAFMESLDRRVRREAWESLTEGYEAHKNTIAALLAGSVRRDVFYARARGYPSSLKAALDPLNVPEGVFHTLIETVAERLPLFHRYMRLRKEVLGVDRLRVYDLYAPLCQIKPPKFSYEEAREIMLEGLAPLGEEYVARLRHGLENGWVDVFESQGKRSGAYSWGAYGTHPYVLMNYQGTLDHLFTLAHEVGHAMHHLYTCENQPYVYSRYPIFLAEVASTTNEAILMDHMLRVEVDPAEKVALLNQYIDQIRGTVIAQVMFAEFEHRAHLLAERGEGLTAESLSRIYREIFSRTLGPDLEMDDRAALGWARIPHFFSGYYVYQYATGYSAAIALSRRILGGGARERQAYLGFLGAGDSDYPIETLKRAGVDLTGPGAVNDALDLFESLLGELEAHLAGQGTAAAPGG